ncbi:hypothetical protein PFISCL1PPCAC_5782, partial [Pristionchus fissidentatus]
FLRLQKMSGRVTRSRVKNEKIKEEMETDETTVVSMKRIVGESKDEVKEKIAVKKKRETKDVKVETEDENKIEVTTIDKKKKGSGKIVKKESEEGEETEIKMKRTKKISGGETEEQRELRESVGRKVKEASIGTNKRLGMHASAAGSVVNSIFDALSIGCTAFALFVRNQRQWNAKPMEESVVQKWKDTIENTSFPIEMILPHGSYLINPGSPDAEKLQKSRDAMLDECTRVERLGITMYNFHPGSSTGVVSREDCIRTVAETIDYVLERTEKISLVVETMAGQGHTVGGTFEEVRSILDHVKGNSKRVGVCIDTCHIFAAGYDIRTKGTYDKTMEDFGRIVGFDRLMGVHLNDSKSELGCKLDRHERIGKGEIGVDTFRFIMNDPRFDNIPLILETPEGDYHNEMMLLYGLEEK